VRRVVSLLWLFALLGAVATCTDADPGAGDSADDSGDLADGDDSSGDGTVPSCDAVDGPYAGEATYYAANGSGNCSFDRSADLMVAA
jgi:expansin